MYRIGIDLGGTKTEGIIIDETGREIFRNRVPTRQESGYEHILGVLTELYNTMVSAIAGENHTLGIGTPGSLTTSGILKNSSTLCLNGHALQKDLTERLGRRPAIQNDANCFTLPSCDKTGPSTRSSAKSGRETTERRISPAGAEIDCSNLSVVRIVAAEAGQKY